MKQLIDSFETQPMTYQQSWRAEDEERVKTLDLLYMTDGRNDPNHQHHSTYTGLWELYKDRMAKPASPLPHFNGPTTTSQPLEKD